ncbi:MAG: Fur family transcriptional regulator [Elusimicrobiota bacterium]
MTEELEILNSYISDRHLRATRQREKILEEFLGTEKHVDVDDIYEQVKREGIGYVTVFRTLEILVKCGLANKIRIGRRIKYEHRHKHRHHDHMICLICGNIIEFCDEKIEEIQERIAKKYSFNPQRHNLKIYGYCKKCRKK